jgi:putative acetyltransferase
MKNDNHKIVQYSDSYKEQLLIVWEKSVLATHSFLAPQDFIEIKKLVQGIDFNALEVYCAIDNTNVLGFMGVADRKIEMLFLLPECIGKGIGKKLVNLAISNLNADKVDVNQQNTHAVNFYQKMGFRVYEQTEKDDQGKDYPLLRMKLE